MLRKEKNTALRAHSLKQESKTTDSTQNTGVKDMADVKRHRDIKET